jgi:hypothetical protein
MVVAFVSMMHSISTFPALSLTAIEMLGRVEDWRGAP